MLRKVTHCAGRVSTNTRPHQLRWGDREMGTVISCTECSQVAGQASKTWRHSPPEIFKIRCSEIASDAVCERSRAVVATWLAEYCIQFLAVHVWICYAS